jgi:hypothetical protein
VQIFASSAPLSSKMLVRDRYRRETKRMSRARKPLRQPRTRKHGPAYLHRLPTSTPTWTIRGLSTPPTPIHALISKALTAVGLRPIFASSSKVLLALRDWQFRLRNRPRGHAASKSLCCGVFANAAPAALARYAIDLTVRALPPRHYRLGLQALLFVNGPVPGASVAPQVFPPCCAGAA